MVRRMQASIFMVLPLIVHVFPLFPFSRHPGDPLLKIQKDARPRQAKILRNTRLLQNRANVLRGAQRSRLKQPD